MRRLRPDADATERRRDTVQTAVAYGIRVAGPSPPRDRAAEPPPLGFTPVRRRQDMRELLEDWLPLTYALNALNRSMGAGPVPPSCSRSPSSPSSSSSTSWCSPPRRCGAEPGRGTDRARPRVPEHDDLLGHVFQQPGDLREREALARARPGRDDQAIEGLVLERLGLWERSPSA